MDEVKRELVREWLLKASRDLTVAKIVARSPEAIWEASLYHCQHAAEKALKGFLAYWDRTFIALQPCQYRGASR
jgi:HEPN domain-containing protein